MNTLASHSLPSMVAISASTDICGLHDDNLKDDCYSDDDSTTVATFLESSASSASTFNSSSSFIIALSGNYDPKEDCLVKKLWHTQTSINNDHGDDCGSEEDSAVMLRCRHRNLQDSNHTSWSDKILEHMGDVDSVIVPLKKDGRANANDYYKNHINNKDSDNVTCHSERIRRQGRRRQDQPAFSDE